MFDKIGAYGFNPLILLTPVGYYLVIAIRRFSAVGEKTYIKRGVYSLVFVVVFLILMGGMYVAKCGSPLILDLVALAVSIPAWFYIVKYCGLSQLL